MTGLNIFDMKLIGNYIDNLIIQFTEDNSMVRTNWSDVMITSIIAHEIVQSSCIDVTKAFYTCVF